MPEGWPEGWDIPVMMDRFGQLLVKPNPGGVQRIGVSEPSAPDSPSSTERLPAAQSLVDLAIADLCDRYHLSLEEVEVWSIMPVTFRDSSLGKPKPGRNYLQVLTSGFKITLRVADVYYRYHGADGRVEFIGPAVLGTAPSTPEPGTF